MRRSWAEARKDWSNPRLIVILLLGFSSGLPLVLTLQTLGAWLKEVGVDKTTIGLFALAGTPYTLKFLWAPLVDRLEIPVLGRLLGRRRSWGLLVQAGLMVSIIGLGLSNPAQHAGTTAAWALAVTTFSATQDIVVDALRVELLAPEQQGAGATASQYGYRIGMLVSGAGALFLADHRAWPVVYMVMALLGAVGMVTLVVMTEPVSRRAARLDEAGRPLRWIESAVVRPFLDFTRRPGWIAILSFVLLYKFGDALLGIMANPFYLEMGFTKSEIAAISKIFGLSMTLAGVALGGVLVSRIGLLKSLLICGIAQAATNLLFAMQAMRGDDRSFLMLTIGADNLAGGMASTALIAYLSSLCNVAYTATQYALLSALSAFARTILSSSSGWIADHATWVAFFVISTLAAVPGLVLLGWMMRRWPPGAADGPDSAAKADITAVPLAPERWYLEEMAAWFGSATGDPNPRDRVRQPVLRQGEHVTERRAGEWWRRRA